MQKRGDPGHHLDTQGMQRPKQCPQSRAHQQIVVLRAVQLLRLDQQQEFPNQQENQRGVGAVEKKACQVIADRLQPE